MMGISLENSYLTGTFPLLVGNWPRLETIILHNNLLTGKIPDNLGNIASLMVLDVGNNLFQGPIPDSLMNLVNLIKLILITKDISEKWLSLSCFKILNHALFLTICRLESYLILQNTNRVAFIGWNNPRGNISFVCDWDMIYVAAYCRGSEPEVNCNYCNTCCSNDDKEDCGIHLSTMILIDNCWALSLLVWCPGQIYN